MRAALACLVLCLGICFASPAFAAAAPALHLALENGFVNVAPLADVYEDPTGALQPQQLQSVTFVPFERMSLDHPSSTYWIRLRYTESAQMRWLLTAGYRPWEADLFIDGQWQHNGDAVPYAQRPERHYNWIAFSLPPSSTEKTAYLRIRTYEPLVNLVAYSRDDFRAMLTRDIVVIAALLGVLGSLALSSIVLYFVMRDTLYLYYAGYIVAQFVYRANDFGLLSSHIFQGMSFPYVRTEVIFDGLTLIAATMFIRRFLRSQAHSRTLDRINFAIAAIGGCYALLALFGVPVRYTLVQNFSFIYVPIWIATGIVCWRKGYAPARLFLFAWTAYMLGILIEAAVDVGLGTQVGIVRESGLDVALDYLVYLGIAIESILLALSLADAYRSANDEKIRHLQELFAMRERTERMAHLAYSDGLTNLPNRVAFIERVDESLRAAQRHGRRCALLYIDVDNFKAINDTFGHQAGDAALIQSAVRLRRTVRGDEMVGRLAGDEFAVFLPDVANEADAEVVRQRVKEAFSESFTLEGNLVEITISIGIAYFPDEAMSREELFARADARMYGEKSRT